MKSQPVVIRLFLLAAILGAVMPAAAQEAPAKVYYAARIWPASQPPIDDGALVVRDGKIAVVGEKAKIQIPQGAKEIDLGDLAIIPGLIVAQTSISAAAQDNEEAITPQLRAVDSYDAYQEYKSIVSGGVTTVQLSPGARRLMPGQGAVVKLAGAVPQERIVRAQESLRLILGDLSENPPGIFEAPIPADPIDNPLLPPRIQLASGRAGTIALLRAIFAAAASYQPGPGPDQQLTAVRHYIKNRLPLRVTATEAADIQAALELAESYHLVLTLVDPEEIFRFKDIYPKLAAQGHGVIFNAGIRPGLIINEPVQDEEAPEREPVGKLVRDLMAAGVAVTIRPADEADLSEMLFVAGLVGQGGLDPQQMLELLTINPARMLRVDDRVGSLAAGRDADFVVLSGDPFAAHATVREVYVDGARVWETNSNDDFTLIQADKIYTGDGRVIPDGSIAIQGKKITSIGPDVSAPMGAKVKRFPAGAVVIPGMIDMRTSITVSSNNNSTAKHVRQGGIATVLNVPAGSGAMPVRAYKLGDESEEFEGPVAMKFAVTGNLTTTVPNLRRTLQRGKDYAETWFEYEKKLTEYQIKLKEYEETLKKWEEAKAAADEAIRRQAGPERGQTGQRTARAGLGQRVARTPPTRQRGQEQRGPEQQPETQEVKLPPMPVKPKEPNEPATQSNLEPYRKLFAGKMLALVEAERTTELEIAVKLFGEEFKMPTMLIGAGDAFREPELWAGKGMSVLVGPEMVWTVDGATINQAQLIVTQGGKIGFGSGATTGSRNLPLAVTYAVRCGLGVGDALAGLTSWPAELLYLDDRIGRLAAGRDADLVVLSGPPFELTSRILAVMIDGQWVYKEGGPKDK